MPQSATEGKRLEELLFASNFVDQLPGERDAPARPRRVERACYSEVTPSPAKEPQLLAHSDEMVRELGLASTEVHRQLFAEVFSGNRQLEGMRPYAACYGGHQFGHWAGQLGDGRAITLGEVPGTTEKQWELQLKGAGLTPYSRSADGRAVLRSSIREFLCSEAMHHLGVPTTRALCLVSTGDEVPRDMFYDGRVELEPGAVVCRAAPTFLRFGSYQIFASRGDTHTLKRLADYTLQHFYPHIQAKGPEAYLAWLREVCRTTAFTVAEWMRVGFVHGVLNTDNMSILGLTIDYGPYGWIDNYDLDWTPNTTDAAGRRYRFGAQPQIAFWNIARLGEALVSLIEDGEAVEQTVKGFAADYQQAFGAAMAGKLGLVKLSLEDTEAGSDDLTLLLELQELLHHTEIDMTIFFRRLADWPATDAPAEAPMLLDAFYEEPSAETMGRLKAWLVKYGQRLEHDAYSPEERRRVMNRANPKFVLRNYLAQQAIEAAYGGDFGEIAKLLEVMRHPYDEQADCQPYAAKRPEWARHKPGCSMLSCSS